MASLFPELVGSLTLEEQQLWLPNQQDHDPDSWTDPHLFQLKMEYEVLMNKYGCQGSRAKSGVTSNGGFSSGYVIVATCSFSADDELLETLGNEHAKVYQLKDAPATGLSHSTIKATSTQDLA